MKASEITNNDKIMISTPGAEGEIASGVKAHYPINLPLRIIEISGDHVVTADPYGKYITFSVNDICFNVDTEEWDKDWDFLIQPENERQWKLSDYLLANSDDCRCDWEAGPWLNKETLPMFKIIRDAVKDYAGDDKKKFNALMDFTLLAFSGTEVDAFDSAEEFRDYVSNITFIILELLNCNNYTKADIDWSVVDLDAMVIKSEEETDGGE